MPFNKLKVYNQLLELNSLNERERMTSLKGIFNRDIVDNDHFCFRTKKLNPTPACGRDSMETLFTHLTTVITERSTNKREYDAARSMRLHWIKYHLEERKQNNMFVFSVDEPRGCRTYIWDKDENYVIILEPLRGINEYYLLTAYYLEGRDRARDKMQRKWERRLQEIR